ncbi:MAG: serine O-acetyltransferase [Gammaproteobacteria bacterium]|jgi:serine O-acetyltransferase|nr:serine O-acetyltransferase [Gammaproteobacteria bacterium]MBT3859232.1 serine O-acetyltransferase [Gammaproteobacteria bacterium]MBT3988100.1 serine O-acetyltransferase [Gammaproteobacteria bacterium]MBT4256677.1 serine O-acetyltransferase [Gammaproteobacteria bacterium]MBT4583031.1 serine O-acetyltransferase [Gammaproteobacteria bacterium]
MSDEIWNKLRKEAEEVIKQEPLLASYVYACILNHDSLQSALSFILATKLSDDVMPVVTVRELFDDAFNQSPEIIDNARCDILAVYERDAAIDSFIPVLLNLKGFQSIQVHRLAHFLWTNGRKDLALFIQSRNSEVFGIDIHPACFMGKGIMFDHATGIVIGETSVIEDNVSILQQVTLGGTGNEHGDRHPKIRTGVLIAAGAKVLGNIEIGAGAKIGAGSVVLKDVAAHTTVVGVPAKSVGVPCCDNPAETMDQSLGEE